jgi:hypothetical protein
MRCKLWSFAIAVTLFAEAGIPLHLAAQDKQDEHQKHHHFRLIDLGTLGGPNSFLSGPGVQTLNNRGTFAGIGNTATPNANPGSFP